MPEVSSFQLPPAWEFPFPNLVSTMYSCFSFSAAGGSGSFICNTLGKIQSITSLSARILCSLLTSSHSSSTRWCRHSTTAHHLQARSPIPTAPAKGYPLQSQIWKTVWSLILMISTCVEAFVIGDRRSCSHVGTWEPCSVAQCQHCRRCWCC